MNMNQIMIDKDMFKKEWSPVEIEKAKKEIDRFFEMTADWDESIKDMGLTYQNSGHHAALCVSGDFYFDEGIRINSFVLSETGALILVGIEDDEGKYVYYELTGY